MRNINPPEAIRNLETPVAPPRSVRPSFFSNSSGQTTVCQTVFLKNILYLDINDHTTVSQTESVEWSLTSYVEKVIEKKPGL